jgi:hypothetical protein
MKFISNIVVIAAITTASFSVCAEVLSKRQLDQYMGIIGAVTAAQQTTRTLSRSCARSFPQLQRQSGNAITAWNRRNGKYVQQSRQLKKRVYSYLGKIGGSSQLEQFKKELHAFTRSQRNSVAGSLRKMKPKEKLYVCGQILTSIDAGKWDIEVAYPAVHNALSSMEKKP